MAMTVLPLMIDVSIPGDKCPDKSSYCLGRLATNSSSSGLTAKGTFRTCGIEEAI